MSNDISKIGAAAIAALKALTAAKANKKSKTAKANELIEERNKTARPLLQQVHDAIVAGQSVNGQNTWDGWAKQAGWSKRALNYILNARKPQTGNTSSRIIKLKPDSVFEVGGVVYKITNDDGGIASHKKPWNHCHEPGCETCHGTTMFTNVTLHGCAIVEEKKEEEKPAPITHARSISPRQRTLSKNRTLCESRLVNLPRIKGKVFAEKDDEATCEKCRRFLDSQKAQTSSERDREWRAEQEANRQTTEEVSEAAKALAATVDAAEVPFDAAGMLEVGRQCRENPACDFNDEEEQL